MIKRGGNAQLLALVIFESTTSDCQHVREKADRYFVDPVVSWKHAIVNGGINVTMATSTNEAERLLPC